MLSGKKMEILVLLKSKGKRTKKYQMVIESWSEIKQSQVQKVPAAFRNMEVRVRVLWRALGTTACEVSYDEKETGVFGRIG